MRNLKRIFRKETGTWVLVGMTLLVGGFSLWTANYLFQSRNRSISPTAPESQPEAVGNCTIDFNLPTPIPCNRDIDIVGVSIDRSSSMNALESDGRTKLAWAKEAALTLVRTLQASGSTTVNLAVNSFGAQGNDGTGTLDSSYNSTLHTGLTGNYDTVMNAIAGVNYVKSGTCIECGIRLSNNQVNTSDPARKVAILLSDGRANHIWNGTEPGSSVSKQAAINAANTGRTNGVSYHVIGYGSTTSPADETTLRAIAGTNGSYQYKPNAQEWSDAFIQILNNICTSTSTPTPTRSTSVTPTPTRVATVTPTRAPTGTPTPTPSASTINLIPTHDAYVHQSYTGTNYGNASTLQSDASPSKIIYMKFDLTSLANKTITSAQLRIRVTSSSSSTQNVKVVSNTSWTESTLTYSNRPGLGSTITTFTGSTSGADKLINLTSFVNNNKGRVVTLAIDQTGTDGLDFYSSEYSTASYRPTLVVR